ncbi:hypothetical protein FB563_6425 [Streptomyces puniciscabiei]|uniref:Uncharacterized protein n=1 Tax=Streptomyces puniciscabiei TaxID=164348 RepID=A0A542THJ0_9ACTN|nr:hypothetical protein [Streptomyces puniciscabiei]TQK86305.1 hypothetical protein FB563_6425 [Streptomyces puniciscabiei]
MSGPVTTYRAGMAAGAGAVLLTVLVTGCGTGDGDSKAGRSAAAGTAVRPAATGCPSGASRPLPGDFPPSLPVPGKATVTSVEHRTGRRLIVTTVVHQGFRSVLSFLQRELPKAHYTLKDGEVEQDDAESDFTSSTVEGRWALRTMPDCPGTVSLTYLTAPRH